MLPFFSGSCVLQGQWAANRKVAFSKQAPTGTAAAPAAVGPLRVHPVHRTSSRAPLLLTRVGSRSCCLLLRARRLHALAMAPACDAATAVVVFLQTVCPDRLPARLGLQSQKVMTARQRAAAPSKALHPWRALHRRQAQARSRNRSRIQRPHSSAAVAPRSQMQQAAAAAWV